MNRRFFLCLLGYALLTMILGPLWYLAIFKDTYHTFAIYNRAEPMIPLGFLSMWIQGAVLAWMFPRWLDRSAPYASGLRFVLLMGVFMFTLTAFAAAAKTEVNGLPAFLGLQAVFHLVQFVATGLIFGWVHRHPTPAAI